MTPTAPPMAGYAVGDMARVAVPWHIGDRRRLCLGELGLVVCVVQRGQTTVTRLLMEDGEGAWIDFMYLMAE